MNFSQSGESLLPEWGQLLVDGESREKILHMFYAKTSKNVSHCEKYVPLLLKSRNIF